MTKEAWKDIFSYEGKYQISSLGRVKSLPRTGRLQVKILKPHFKKGGYLEVSLSKNSSPRYCLISRLVAQAFIPNPQNKLYINHKNGVKKNNTTLNLEWCTFQENEAHAIKLGLKGPLYQGYAKGEQVGTSKLLEKQVIEIRKLKFKNPLLTQSELSERFKVSQSQIGRILRKQRWQHLRIDNYGVVFKKANTKLTETDVLYIRKAREENQKTRKELSVQFGVKPEQIRRVETRERWKNI